LVKLARCQHDRRGQHRTARPSRSWGAIGPNRRRRLSAPRIAAPPARGLGRSRRGEPKDQRLRADGFPPLPWAMEL